jgi:hypothetical protein
VNAEWNETEPPKDGSPLVLCGGVVVKDEVSTCKIPFCALAYWESEMKDWRYWESGLAVRRALEDEVIVHFWMPYPQAEPGARPAHFPSSSAAKTTLAGEILESIGWDFGYALGGRRRYARDGLRPTFSYAVATTCGLLRTFLRRIPREKQLMVGSKIRRALTVAMR